MPVGILYKAVRRRRIRPKPISAEPSTAVDVDSGRRAGWPPVSRIPGEWYLVDYGDSLQDAAAAPLWTPLGSAEWSTGMARIARVVCTRLAPPCHPARIPQDRSNLRFMQAVLRREDEDERIALKQPYASEH